MFLECVFGCPVETDVRGARVEAESPVTGAIWAGDDNVFHWACSTGEGEKGCHSR